MSEENHHFWAPESESEEHVFGSDELRNKFLILGGLNIACLIALCVGVSLLGVRGFTPPYFLGYSQNLFFAGKAAPISTINWDEDMRQQFVDTVEVLFLRTEKGALPALSKFVEQSVLDQVEKGYRGETQRLKPGFAQTFTVVESRQAPSPRAPVRRWHMMGLLSSRGLDGSQNSTLYFQCDFAPRGSNDENATGWKLVSITRLREDEYFSEERERDRIRRLGLENADDSKPTTPISSGK